MFKQVCEAVNTISDVAQGKATGAGQMPYEGPGELASALDDFDVSTLYYPCQVNLKCFVLKEFWLYCKMWNIRVNIYSVAIFKY